MRTYYDLVCKKCGVHFKRTEKRFQYCSIGCRMVAPGKDMVGDVYGWLTVIEELERKYNSKRTPQRQFKCKCKCGEVVIKTYDGIRNKGYKTPSCGCFMHWHATNRIKHGMTHTSIYNIWAGLKARCYKPNVRSYKNYGAKGIKVCDRWLHSFENFWEDMGATYKQGLTLDRYPDQKGNYEPTNCRWATYKEQARNMSTNRMLTVLGYTACMGEWAEILNTNGGKFAHRIRRGATVEDAVLGKNEAEIEVNKLKIKQYYESLEK